MDLHGLWKPTYLFRPQQLLVRAHKQVSRVEGDALVVLPWRTTLVVPRADAIGSGLLRQGVHELSVTELLWRLTAPDDLALDVGANVGYFTSLFAVRGQHVLSFEPHPTHVARLRRAMPLWHDQRDAQKVEIWPNAVSDEAGEAMLSMPKDFEANEGQASLSLLTTGGAGITVRTVTLDAALQGRHVGVMKLDVEGHELAALQGAAQALAQGHIRDIVFEEHGALPTGVSQLLEHHGYTLFGIAEGLMGVDLVPPEQLVAPRWDAPMYLATRAPERAQRLTKPRRWRSLRPRGIR